MASPKIEVVAVYNPTTGAPLPGVAGSLTFSVYKDDTGANVMPVPTITEIGGGLYKFTPTLPANPARALVYVLNTGGNLPANYFRLVRPEDWNDDFINDLMDVALGKWQIFNSGPDANRLVLYKQDGVTVLKKFDLRDLSGNPSITNVFQRLPV